MAIDTISYVFTGERDEDDEIAHNYAASHYSTHESVTVIPFAAFSFHPSIMQLLCHCGVKRIEEEALSCLSQLKYVIIPGVEIVEEYAFAGCRALEYIDCDRLKRIEESAFKHCTSLGSINLPSAKIIGYEVFAHCKALRHVKCGRILEEIKCCAFLGCHSLERITIPLKSGLFRSELEPFEDCANLKYVDLVEGLVLHDTITALLMEEWRNDMHAEVGSINQILPRLPNLDDIGEFAEKRHEAINEWIARVLKKIIHYKAQHRRIVNEALPILQLSLPNDIAMNSVLPFLELPNHMFEGEENKEQGQE